MKTYLNKDFLNTFQTFYKDIESRVVSVSKVTLNLLMAPYVFSTISRNMDADFNDKKYPDGSGRGCFDGFVGGALSFYPFYLQGDFFVKNPEYLVIPLVTNVWSAFYESEFKKNSKLRRISGKRFLGENTNLLIDDVEFDFVRDNSLKVVVGVKPNLCHASYEGILINNNPDTHNNKDFNHVKFKLTGLNISGTKLELSKLEAIVADTLRLTKPTSILDSYNFSKSYFLGDEEIICKGYISVEKKKKKPVITNITLKKSFSTFYVSVSDVELLTNEAFNYFLLNPNEVVKEVAKTETYVEGNNAMRKYVTILPEDSPFRQFKN